ncbi:hypothetical protein [Corynebacterium lubricantis]|nr:hypothetical protein [Corynebacterium lubricantis]
MPQINPRNYRPRRALNPTAVKAIMTAVTIMGGLTTALLVGMAYSAVIM